MIGEGAWIWLWIRHKTGERALLYVAAVFTSLFVSTKVTAWFMRRFMNSGNTFMWLLDQIKESTHPVGIVMKVMPPVPTMMGMSGESRWVALHVLQGILSVVITAAIFFVFVVVEYLMDAFWDDERTPISRGDRTLTQICAAVCGLTTVVVTLWFLANLSWLSNLHGLADEASRSVFFAFFGHVTEFLRNRVAML